MADDQERHGITPREPIESRKSELTPAQQVALKLSDAFGGEVSSEYQSSMIAGQGQYKLTVPAGFSRRRLAEVGFEEARAMGLERTGGFGQTNLWRVPADIMEQAIPGAAGMNKQDLADAIRKKTGADAAVVTDASTVDTYVVGNIPTHISRSNLVGEANRSKVEGAREGAPAYLFVPEAEMHQAMGIETNKKGLGG